MKRVIFIGIVILVMVSLAVAAGPTHLDRAKLPYTCAYCHRPHTRASSGLLREPVPQLCYLCHGLRQWVPTASSYIKEEFQKRYHHPVDKTAALHRADEEFPEKNPAKQRHVSCLDCHNVHASVPDNPIKSVPGYSIYGKKVIAVRDSEVCYKCHAESANRPPESEDMRALFDPANPSYHPVDTMARNLSPSLYPGLTGKTISCTDCHNPHGSDIKGMLRKNYSLDDTPESVVAYELCYSCHRRTDILSDRTFPWHKLHVVYNSISCNACHDPHGSPFYPGLVRFRADVGPNAQNILMYVKEKDRMECFLNCHGVEHNGQDVIKQ